MSRCLRKYGLPVQRFLGEVPMKRWICRFRSTAISFFLAAFVLIATSPGHAQQSGILTPAPSPKPQINGPTIYGLHPGHPLLYRIPATGDRPMTFSAKHLPAGVMLDPQPAFFAVCCLVPGNMTSHCRRATPWELPSGASELLSATKLP